MSTHHESQAGHHKKSKRNQRKGRPKPVGSVRDDVFLCIGRVDIDGLVAVSSQHWNKHCLEGGVYELLGDTEEGKGERYVVCVSRLAETAGELSLGCAAQYIYREVPDMTSAYRKASCVKHPLRDMGWK